MAGSIYGSGHTIATAVRETRQETIKTVLTRYVDEYYVDKQTLSGKPSAKYRPPFNPPADGMMQRPGNI